MALEIFHYQVKHVPVYRKYVEHVAPGADPQSPEEIPFLPVSFFKNHEVSDGYREADAIVFSSTGTGGIGQSRHHVFSERAYLSRAHQCFAHFFGDAGNFRFLNLVPSYAERSGSSLLLMLEDFGKQGNHKPEYFLYNHDDLIQILHQCKNDHTPVILWGVTFALLDFCENYRMEFPDLKVIETGGMKGRRAEITRNELHAVLSTALGTGQIFSEYGMTELMSQAYSTGNGIYHCPPGMKVFPRCISDPLSAERMGRNAALNVVDLYNLHSCSFIATEDLGRVEQDGSFTVAGRLDHSDLRGCSMMTA